MIEIDSNNIIKILNWDKHQNIEGMERVRAQNRKRAENHREKKKQIEETTKGNYEEEKQNTDQVNVQYDKEESSEVNKEDNANYIENTNDSLSNNINDDSNSITNNSCGVINNLGSVTKNKSNVTVTEQNKRESKNKKENKKKIEIESEDNNITGDINNKGSTFDEKVQDLSLSQSEKLKENSIAIADDINAKAIEIMTYYEKITGVIGGINYGALRLAIDMHGSESVKMAINKALEINQTDMRYINGILKNWRREGYPNQREEIKNGTRSTGKSNAADKNEFTGFKPKKPRNLTESERKEAQEDLI
jgi:DnaD/phage-associated family protein